MNVLALPGRDRATEAWIGQVLSALELPATTVQTLHYRHWNGTPLDHFGAPYSVAIRDFCRDVPTLFVQQTADVTTPFADIRRALADIDRTAFVEVPGSDHVYSDVDLLAHHLRGWCGAQ